MPMRPEELAQWHLANHRRQRWARLGAWLSQRGGLVIYRNRGRYIWGTAWWAWRLPRALDPLWRKLASRPRVLRNVRWR